MLNPVAMVLTIHPLDSQSDSLMVGFWFLLLLPISWSDWLAISIIRADIHPVRDLTMIILESK